MSFADEGPPSHVAIALPSGLKAAEAVLALRSTDVPPVALHNRTTVACIVAMVSPLGLQATSSTRSFGTGPATDGGKAIDFPVRRSQTRRLWSTDVEAKSWLLG